jgi:HNH endonuclease
MVRISDTLRQQVMERARGLCEYCQTAQIIVVTMEIDHIVPQSAGGETELGNLCLVCRGCNSFKQDFQSAIDPQTEQDIALFNPRTEQWSTHFHWAEDGIIIVGLTATGRATIQRLRMNRDGIVASRRLWVQAGWHPPSTDRFPLA